VDRIRILLADDEAKFRELVRTYLASRPEFEIVAEAGDGSEAVAAALEHKPAVILCDVNMPVMDGLEVTQRLFAALPDAVILVVSGNEYDAFSKKAIAAGARDYVSKPVDLPQLAQKILDTLARAQELARSASQRKKEEENASKLFGFYSPKGSAGSTSLAVNAALELARSKQRVLLIDLNLQFGDVEFLLDLKTKVSLSDMIDEAGEFLTYKIAGGAESHSSGVRCVYQHKLEHAEMVTAAHVGSLMKYARGHKDFDFILVDLPRQLEERTLSAIDALDTFFLVVTEDYLAVKNAKLCKELFAKLGYTDKKLKVLVNKVAGGTPATHVQTHLGAPFATFPLEAKLFEQAVKAGFPPIIEHPSAPFSRAVADLVGRAMMLKKETGGEAAAAQAAGGGIGSLFKRLFS
jgi:pilus assembly protein CpaE